MPAASIHEACSRGDVDAIRAFIAADPALVDADDEHGWRPIFHAGLWRREAVVRLLIESGADLAAHDGYVMHYAGEVPNNKPIVSLLIQYGAWMPTSGRRMTCRVSSWRRYFSRCRRHAVDAWQASPPGDDTRRSRRSADPPRGPKRRYGNCASADRARRGRECYESSRAYRTVLRRRARPSRYAPVAPRPRSRLRRQVSKGWSDFAGMVGPVPG